MSELNSVPAAATTPWDIPTARSLYNIDRWGAGYFDVNEAGNVVVTPLREKGSSIEIADIIEEARERKLQFPLLIRFQDILRDRVAHLNNAFRNSITEFQFKGSYRGVFPIKVNQLREVVEEILDAGKAYNFGLEVGSKPELYAWRCRTSPEASSSATATKTRPLLSWLSPALSWARRSSW